MRATFTGFGNNGPFQPVIEFMDKKYILPVDHTFEEGAQHTADAMLELLQFSVLKGLTKSGYVELK